MSPADPSFVPAEDSDSEDEDHEDQHFVPLPTEDESGKAAPIAHPIELLLNAMGEEAPEPLWKTKELSEMEWAMKDRVEELLSSLGKNERRLVSLLVYYMARELGATRTTALKWSSLHTDVPERTLRRWRAKGEATGELPLDARITTSEETYRGILGMLHEEIKMPIINFVRANTNQPGARNATAEDVMHFINGTLLKH